MKKITFILLALISGTAFAQDYTANAVVNAKIVQPISVTVLGALDFATIVPPKEQSEKVVLSPTNQRNIPTDMQITGQTTTSVPTFKVSKEQGLTYGIDIEVTEKLTNNGIELPLTDIVTNLGKTNGITENEFSLGGTLTVSSSQVSGAYTGKIKVTVSYE